MANGGHEDGCAALQGVHLKCTCEIGTVAGVAGDAGCTECGRDNRNGTHDALQQFGHLAHDYTPPRDDTMDVVEALAAGNDSARRARTPGGIKSLSEMAEEVYNFEVSKGWQPNSNTFGDSLALLHSEISEALEAFREIGFASRNTRKPFDPLGTPKPDDVPSELIDVYIRLLATWHQFMAPLGFLLEAEYERKMAYNRTRPQRHGGKAL